MTPNNIFVFGAYQLDLNNVRLWKDQKAIPLRPKALAVLAYLARYPDRLISQQTLLKEIWPGRYVTVGSLRACIHEIRKALEDDAAQPRYIETVGHKGYRFLGTCIDSTAQHRNGELAKFDLVVGRQLELTQLEYWYESAVDGDRQFVFITGEAGSGKTTLVDLFLQRLNAKHAPTIGRGHCFIQLGHSEPYKPLLEALYELSRDPAQQRVVERMHQLTPAWLALLPDLLNDEELERCQKQLQLMASTRMQQLFAELVSALGAETPLVLVIEDLHWCDPSTLQLLSYLAQYRRSVMHLLVLLTYRSNEPTTNVKTLNTLRDELLSHRLCHSMELAALQPAEISAYISVRLNGRVDICLAEAIYSRTNGNALFTVALLEHLIKQNLIQQRDSKWSLHLSRLQTLATEMPREVGLLLKNQFTTLSKLDQDILAAASVTGSSFVTTLVAAGLGQELEWIETRCEVLAQDFQLIDENTPISWPDGTLNGCYRFRHALYRQVIYAQISQSKRSRLHLQVGKHLAKVYGAKSKEIAEQLAYHFEQGGQQERAAHYHADAAEFFLARHAITETLNHCHAGLNLLTQHQPQAFALELRLSQTLAAGIIINFGWAHEKLFPIYQKARLLSQQCADLKQEFQIVNRLRIFHLMRGKLSKAKQMLQEMESINQRLPSEEQQLELDRCIYQLAFVSGDSANSPAIVEHQYDVNKAFKRFPKRYYDQLHAAVIGQSIRKTVLWYRGYPDQALALSQKSVEMSEHNGTPWELAGALQGLALIHQLRREPKGCLFITEKLEKLIDDFGLHYWLCLKNIHQAWVAITQGYPDKALNLLLQAQHILEQFGMTYGLGYIALLRAEIALANDTIQDGLNCVAKGFEYTETTGNKVLLAEFYRLQGELLWRIEKDSDKAEQALREALSVARQQNTRSLELRAALSLARIWQHENRGQDGEELLVGIYEWFAEGFNTADLKEAKMLLAKLR